MDMLSRFLSREGLMYEVERNGQMIKSEKGLPNYDKNRNADFIGFTPGTDVQVGDWLISPNGERCNVAKTETSYFGGKAQQLECYYVSEQDYGKSENANVSIQNVYGSVIGNQNQGISINQSITLKDVKLRVYEENQPDKEELLELIQIIENATKSAQPIHKGLLSRFSGVMERNSWITGAIASALLSWLAGTL